MTTVPQTIPTGKPVRAVVYCRVSTDDQADDEVSIAAQIRECQSYAADRGWLVVEVFQDAGMSGRTDERPDFQRMIAQAKQKTAPFNIILVWKLNRLSRSLEHRIAYQNLLRRRDIKIVSLKEPAMEGAMAALVEPILAAIDEFMAIQVGEDTLRGLKEIARQGYSAGGRPPVGFRGVQETVSTKRDGSPLNRTTWQPDPDWSPRLLLTFEMAAEGRTSQDIMAATGICANKSSLSTILRNRAYLGERVYNKERHLGTKKLRRKNDEADWVVTPNAHPAIVSPDLFARVQAIQDKRKPRTGSTRAVSSPYLLTPILRCTRHDCNFIAYTVNDRLYYICGERARNGAQAVPCPLLKQDALDSFILERLREELFTPERLRPLLEEMAAAVEGQAEEDKREAKKLRAEIATLDTELARFYQAIADGVGAANLAKPIEERQTRKTDLEKRLTKLQWAKNAPRKIELSDEALAYYIRATWELIEHAEGHDRKVLVQESLKQIEVDGNQVTLTYTFNPPTSVVGFYWLPEQVSNQQYYTPICNPRDGKPLTVPALILPAEPSAPTLIHSL